MSIILRDPLFRDLLLADMERDRYLRPHVHRNHLVPQPVRVQRMLDHDLWPATRSFDNALNELQTVMDTMNEAIGQYQSSFGKDLVSGGMKTIRTEDGNLQLALDVSQFKPEEVNVKLCDDNLVVEAKTETSENDSYHKAELKRWIKLPQDTKHEAIKSTLTADKRLLIEVPMNKPIEDSRSRSIPINIQREAVEGAKKGQQNGGDHQQQQNKQQQQAQK